MWRCKTLSRELSSTPQTKLRTKRARFGRPHQPTEPLERTKEPQGSAGFHLQRLVVSAAAALCKRRPENVCHAANDAADLSVRRCTHV